MKRPRLLDLFCGAGGAAMGYHRAGFDVVGVDLAAQPRYPFEFHQGDALAFLRAHGHEFDAIHASPPCQAYSAAMRHLAKPQPKLIDPLRRLLRKAGVPWVIENVVGAPLRDPLILCGTMFSLLVYRHRLFESPFLKILAPPCDHRHPAMNPHRAESRERIYAEYGRQDPEILWRGAMGVNWMNRQETRESIPPVYTEYVGRALRAALKPALARAA
jgi:DNA (cytosine-5)-methyltransferase 1